MMGDGAFVPPPLTSPSVSDEKKQKILEVLEDNGGDLNRTSVVLGVSASSLRRRLRQWAEPSAPPFRESPSPTRRFYERIKNPWKVTSFDTDKREACSEISTPSGKTHLSFTVPLPFTRFSE